MHEFFSFNFHLREYFFVPHPPPSPISFLMVRLSTIISQGRVGYEMASGEMKIPQMESLLAGYDARRTEEAIMRKPEIMPSPYYPFTPLTGRAKEAKNHACRRRQFSEPELLIDLIYVFFGYILLSAIVISVQQQNETFIKVFPEFINRRITHGS